MTRSAAEKVASVFEQRRTQARLSPGCLVSPRSLPRMDFLENCGARRKSVEKQKLLASLKFAVEYSRVQERCDLLDSSVKQGKLWDIQVLGTC
jgi:hypothetical protein